MGHSPEKCGTVYMRSNGRVEFEGPAPPENVQIGMMALAAETIEAVGRDTVRERGLTSTITFDGYEITLKIEPQE